MDSKSLLGVEIKNADKGEVSAVFSTFNVIDADRDVTLPGAFTDGEEVLISSYQHTSWQGALPVGKGTIRSTASEAVFDGTFFMDIPEARNTFQVIKQLGVKQQWSYGYDVLDAAPGTFDGQDVQFLKALKVIEVSPVLKGAGINTRTLSAKAHTEQDPADLIKKGRSVSDYRAAVRPHETPYTMKGWSALVAEQKLTDLPSISELRSMYAWCDPDGDPELKSSYRFPHHDGPTGPANIRACMMGIAKLNGAAGGTNIPDQDRRGVYNHLAAHMIDADLEPAELRPATGGPLKFHEDLAAALASVDSVLGRASEVMALRRSKSKSLASISVLQLEWLLDGMKALRVLLDTPQEDAAREYARYVQSLLLQNIQGEN